MTFLGMLVRILIVLLALYYIYKLAFVAYDFGFKVFTEEAVSEGDGLEVVVHIPEGASAMEIGEILEERGLVDDRRLFFVRSLLSAYRGKLRGGTYTLNTSMKSEDMMKVMSPSDDEDSEKSDDG
ncbi:MAG: aminodeoxychorismate lyase [Lachnospiraceae bacterium]|nr:aminodeoxychorismate lyase [Lachnospiraceae bacterium]